jgi:hypothetical protein
MCLPESLRLILAKRRSIPLPRNLRVLRVSLAALYDSWLMRQAIVPMSALLPLPY